MHPNPVFRDESASKILEFASEIGFGHLTLNGPDVPLSSYIPFIIDPDASMLWLHFVRSNPIARAVSQTAPALLTVLGPHGYISPDWYEVDDQVPTWNYMAAAIKGQLVRCPDDALPDLLERQSTAFESRLAPKPIWTLDKLTNDTRTRMLRQIVPYRFEIESLDATWKLGQNKPVQAQSSAGREVSKSKIGSDTQTLGDHMQMR